LQIQNLKYQRNIMKDVVGPMWVGVGRLAMW